MQYSDGTTRVAWREDKENAANGPLYDLGSHLIDQALELVKLLGLKPRDLKVTGVLKNLRGQSIDDFFVITLEGETDENEPVLFSLHASMLAKLPGPRFIVHGTKGSLIIEGLDAQEAQLRSGMKPGDLGFGYDTDGGRAKLYLNSAGKSMELEPGRYVEFYENLAQTLLSGAPEKLAVKPSEASGVIKIIEAVRKSSQEQRSISISL